jgi:hypothetical protein
VVFLASFSTRLRPALEVRLERLWRFPRRFRAAGILAIPACYALVIWLVYFPPDFLFDDPLMFGGLWARLGLVLLAGLLAAPFWNALLPGTKPAESLALSIMLLGGVYKTVYYFPQVSPSPFSLGWSEGSRFYYGSLFQSTALYGERFPLPFLHPSRYLLLSLPFLVPAAPLWAHRLWQVLLWLGTTALSAWLLSRRLGTGSRPRAWIASAWAFLFLFQGPVYYHLLVCVIPVLAWFDRRRVLRSLVVVVLASAWAGISRINWIPMPAFLTVMLYLLDTPLAGGWRGLWIYLRSPLLWGAAGGAAAVGANALYIAFSGQSDPGSFGSSFTSDLLWYRLWPSPTYPPGILPMALLLSAPLWLAILANLRRANLHPLRWLGLAGMTGVMFAGGLVVSVKIGGGSNMHNMDAYLVLLAVWGAILMTRGATPEQPRTANPARRPWPLLAMILVMPLGVLMMEGAPVTFPNQSDLREEAGRLRVEVEAAAAQGGEVLFIWQRQFLTFNEVDGVRLVYDYETVDLMEMAMAGNRVYLDNFYRRLAGHEFSLIVAEAQNDFIRGAEDAFPEENNVWVERVTRPLLQYYRPRTTYPVTGTQLLEPIP